MEYTYHFGWKLYKRHENTEPPLTLLKSAGPKVKAGTSPHLRYFRLYSNGVMPVTFLKWR